MVKGEKQWKPRPGESELLDQIRVAARQIDAEPGGRLGWVVRFVRQDPENWLPADREAHGYRLLACAHPAFGMPPYSSFLVGGTNLFPLSGREVGRLHAELRDRFRAFVTVPVGQKIKIPTDGLRTCLVRVSAAGVKPAIFGWGDGGPLRTMLWQAIARLVAKSDRLLACRQCGEPFLALRKAVFCSPSCTQRWHDRDGRKLRVEKKLANGGRGR